MYACIVYLHVLLAQKLAEDFQAPLFKGEGSLRVHFTIAEWVQRERRSTNDREAFLSPGSERIEEEERERQKKRGRGHLGVCVWPDIPSDLESRS